MRTLLSFLVLAFLVVGCGSNNNPPAPPPQPPAQQPGQPTGQWPQQSYQYILNYCQNRLGNGYSYGANPQQAQGVCGCYIGGLQRQYPDFNMFIQNEQQIQSSSQNMLATCYQQAGMSYWGGSSCNYDLVYIYVSW